MGKMFPHITLMLHLIFWFHSVDVYVWNKWRNILRRCCIDTFILYWENSESEKESLWIMRSNKTSTFSIYIHHYLHFDLDLETVSSHRIILIPDDQINVRLIWLRTTGTCIIFQKQRNCFSLTRWTTDDRWRLCGDFDCQILLNDTTVVEILDLHSPEAV